MPAPRLADSHRIDLVRERIPVPRTDAAEGRGEKNTGRAIAMLLFMLFPEGRGKLLIAAWAMFINQPAILATGT